MSSRFRNTRDSMSFRFTVFLSLTRGHRPTWNVEAELRDMRNDVYMSYLSIED